MISYCKSTCASVCVGRAAQHSALATTNNLGIDIIIFSEQHRNIEEKDRWFSDESSRAAVAVLGILQVDNIGLTNQGFRWVEASGYRIYSCNCSPNVSLTYFEDFVGEFWRFERTEIRFSKDEFHHRCNAEGYGDSGVQVHSPTVL
ncbi:Uncharacterized protein FWK35_00024199 [Aphis craccivora]|uniref:Uncharacterized protein n=1 Tax=Aphis craccivora TaxID=307492 RepID=A0A6G0VYY6_APHCR|nr:Uncharacterized protein FWK35_00024199 [Aphis craccivora]